MFKGGATFLKHPVGLHCVQKNYVTLLFLQTLTDFCKFDTQYTE